MAFHLFFCYLVPKLVEEMSQKSKVISYNSAACAWATGRKWQLALCLLNGMSEARLPPNVISWTTAMSACQEGPWQHALGLLEGMRTAALSPNAFSYRVAMKCLHWEYALSLLFEADAHVAKSSFDGALAACARGRAWEQAFSLMWTTRLSPSRFTTNVMNTAMTACKGQWQQALILLEVMQKFRLRSIISYTVALSACAQAGQWIQALSLFKSLSAEERTVMSGSAVISSLEKATQWQRALNLFSVMLTNLEPDVMAYHAVVSACEKGGQWQHALNFLAMHRKMVCQAVALGNGLASAIWS